VDCKAAWGAVSDREIMSQCSALGGFLIFEPHRLDHLVDLRLANGANGTSDMAGSAATVAVERGGSSRDTMKRAGRPRHRSQNPRGDGKGAGNERIKAFGAVLQSRIRLRWTFDWMLGFSPIFYFLLPTCFRFLLCQSLSSTDSISLATSRQVRISTPFQARAANSLHSPGIPFSWWTPRS
jgi:hypothetical protein